jgi:hypothetical protein
MEREEALLAKIAEYEKRMGIGNDDPARKGYLVLVSILRQQNEYLELFNIKTKISSEDKGIMAEYKNAKDLWENLPKMIENVSNLKLALKMEGEEKKIIEKPLSASDIANGQF